MSEQRKIFISNMSFGDAAMQAKIYGYMPIGQAMNEKGQFVVFGRKIGYW